MDPRRVENLINACSTSETRRRLLTLLAALPLGGVLSSLGAEQVGAEHPNQRLDRRTRQRNRKQRRRRRNNQDDGGNSPGGGGQGSTPDATCVQTGDCPANTICYQSVCQPCDVCQKGCAFSDIRRAMESSAQPATLLICPGTYDRLIIDRSVTLIGAGSDNVESSNTILQPQEGANSVVMVNPDDAVVTLQGFYITGGNNPQGGGISNNGALTLTAVQIARNTATEGGGIYNRGSVTLTDCSVTENTASAGGGIYSGGGPVQLQRGTLISGNTPDNCGGPGPYAG